ncbi:MAG TPA: hypothetical protein VMM76_11170 [Pirellulaceae bacterium]|nr:hypothetical protein [Pirellulaceae bacterium]
MSWDLSARFDGNYIDIESNVDARVSLVTAAKEVIRLAGARDLFFTKGAVHGSASMRMWHEIVGRKVEGTTIRKEDVQRYFDLFRTYVPDELEKNDLVAYWSIRLLLKVCVEQGYSVEVNI